MTKKIALLGDYDETVTAHIAIPKALEIAAMEIAATTTNASIDANWLNSTAIENNVGSQLADVDGIWCVPASPYKNMDGVLNVIQYARENNIPFLGTCGGYQHAVLEFARNVLGYKEADNQEVNADTSMPLVSALSCALIEQTDSILLVEGSQIANIYERISIEEKYHCSYGVSHEYLSIFNDSTLNIVGFDVNGDPRCFELTDHVFFMGTGFQPERSALSGEAHPLINAFVSAVCAHSRVT